MDKTNQTTARVDDEKMDKAQENAPDADELKPTVDQSQIENLDDLVEVPDSADDDCAARVPTGEQEYDEEGNAVMKAHRVGWKAKKATNAD